MLRVGNYVKFVPYPVISGFMSGIGVIIILLQDNPLLGLPPVSSPLEAILLAVRMGRQARVVISEDEDHGEFADHELEVQERSGYGIRIVTIDGPFFFG